MVQENYLRFVAQNAAALTTQAVCEALAGKPAEEQREVVQAFAEAISRNLEKVRQLLADGVTIPPCSPPLEQRKAADVAVRLATGHWPEQFISKFKN